ncbi:hypothetical protein [Burkholderia cepacia]|uniref:hypothetical protein n=1 Tax=Burkholderia cepacia TaxID=292 RepID=UPI0007565BBD|nr:hypothetical protein [Burkholderia cepacia]KVA52774.1 hypothetical protein WI47_14095 [Burkholderia cepacia]KVC16510.1 hypothetical protein WI70_02385 [Burkholderia cepacia]KVS72387.1 hypothetical protein WK40_02870 [Burkholderia cepacia]KWB31670.1 hypothetical protein WL34_28060 [Burkholderia cepacia]RQT81870.1 hypothetical protein DF023_21590 [Burkholderia cepacia]
MQQQERILTAANVNQITENFLETLASLGDSIHGLRGIPLLTALKREKLVHGPYPGVTLFEAANRIMSDLVILRGVAGLIRTGMFGIESYLVEFGNEDRNGFDIRGVDPKGRALVGEAFNVAPSFFGPKKQKAVSKLRLNGGAATYRLLLVNDDAVATSYAPRTEPGLQYVFVNIESGAIRVAP